MLRHYCTLALRNARRSPVAAAVNVLTLALGLACFVVAYAFVAFWEGAERHFANADRIAVLTTSLRLADGGFGWDDSIRSPDVAAQYLRADFPQIERIARASLISDKTAAASSDRTARLAAVAIDPEFLELFELPFIAGDARRAVAAPRSVVLTQAAAAQLFGDADPLGGSVRIQNLVDATVTGVIDAIPEPSHMGRSKTAALRFDLLASRDVLETISERTRDPNVRQPSENWLGSGGTTYMLLPRDGSFSIASLHEALDDFAERHVPQETLRFAGLEFGVVPVREVLGRGIDAELFFTDIGMSISAVMLLLGGLVLAVACVNYANLATARAVARLREVGVRKALGAQSPQVMLQHLAEAALVSLAASLLAVVAFLLARPLLTALAGVDLGPVLLTSWRFWAGLIAVIVLATLAAGAYPAFALSRIEPARAIRASRAVLGPRRLSTLLVGTQFAIASFLLIVVAITAMQNAALKRTGLSTPADALVVVVDNSNPTARVDGRTFREELRGFPEILAVTETANVPWASFSATGIRTSPDETAPPRTVEAFEVGFDFFSVFDIRPIAGRVFGREHGDETRSPGRESVAPITEERIVVDRALTEEVGFVSPEAAVGAIVYRPGAETATPLRIVGVVEDRITVFFDVGATRGSIYQLRDELPYQMIKIAGDDIPAALDRIDSVWTALAPGVAIERLFVDEIFGLTYESYMRISQLFTGLAALAFLISVTGLYGTATLAAGRRKREIGVRKAHGASSWRIVRMLLGNFSSPIVVANVAAWPLAFVAVRGYLQTFRNPIEIGLLPFVFSLVVVCAVAWLAVAAQTLRAARTRPADVLRYE